MPPINLRLPRAYRAEHCFQKAAEECERQLEWHSLAPELWAELVLAYRGKGAAEMFKTWGKSDDSGGRQDRQ